MAAIGFLVAALGLLGGALAARQQPAIDAFEVVSIKPNTSTVGEGRFRALAGGRYEWTNVPTITLIQAAYQRFNFDERDIVGAPAWVREERYDVIAQLAGPPPRLDPDGFPRALLALFRGMLEDRFQLRTHWETREGPVYLLTVARQGTLGPLLKPVEADCATAMSNLTTGKPVARRAGRGPDCTFGGAPQGLLQGNAVTIEMLARMLGGEDLHRKVIDWTGLTGNFDVDLRYQPQRAIGPDAPPPANDAPSIFTAVQEQLGLKLVSDRGPIDVQIIDRIERPTEN